MIKQYKKRNRIFAVLYDGSDESVESIKELCRMERGFAVRTEQKHEFCYHWLAFEDIAEEPFELFLSDGDYVVLDETKVTNRISRETEEYVNEYYRQY